MASGAAASQMGASELAVAVALLRIRWQEAKLASTADPEVLDSAQSELFRSIDVALDSLGGEGTAGLTSGVFSGAAQFGAVDGASGASALVVEDVATLSPVRCDYPRDSRGSDADEAWNTLFYLSNVEREVLSVFRKHRKIAADVACSSAEPCVWLFVDVEMFLKATGFEYGQATVLWDRWMRTVSVERIWGGCKIVVAIDELPRD